MSGEKTESVAEQVLNVLSERDIPISEGTRRLISGCHDPAGLQHWLDRARKASSVEDVLEPETE